MKTKLLCGLLAVALVAPASLADSIGPGGSWDSANQTFGNIKVGPAAESDVYTVPVSYHATFGFANWAGVGFTVGFDTHEIDAINLFAGPGFHVSQPGVPGTGAGPVGVTVPNSGSTWNNSLVVTMWNSNAWNSGQTPPVSTPFPIATLSFHVKGSTTIYNSDIDITLDGHGGFGGASHSPFNIWHVTTAMNSEQVTLYPSALVYVPLGATPSGWSPVDPGSGTWVHVTETVIKHLRTSTFPNPRLLECSSPASGRLSSPADAGRRRT